MTTTGDSVPRSCLAPRPRTLRCRCGGVSPRSDPRAREEVGLFPDPNEVHDGAAFAAVGHWTTPEEVPRRYDTRFFLARHPGGEARVADDELVEVWWERPADTLARLEAGELDAITPTISFLTSLSRYRHVADAFAGTELGHRHAFAWGITTF